GVASGDRPEMPAIRGFAELPPLERPGDGGQLLRSHVCSPFPRDRPRMSRVGAEVGDPLSRRDEIRAKRKTRSRRRGLLGRGRFWKTTLFYKVREHKLLPVFMIGVSGRDTLQYKVICEMQPRFPALQTRGVEAVPPRRISTREEVFARGPKARSE